MKTPRKHADLIKAWADGAQIQWYDDSIREHRWKDCGDYFDWGCGVEFRIKPEQKPDVVYELRTYEHSTSSKTYGLIMPHFCWPTDVSPATLRLVFDGSTGKLKSAEVL
jgi:hypothetical protein